MLSDKFQYFSLKLPKVLHVAFNLIKKNDAKIRKRLVLMNAAKHNKRYKVIILSTSDDF